MEAALEMLLCNLNYKCLYITFILDVPMQPALERKQKGSWHTLDKFMHTYSSSMDIYQREKNFLVTYMFHVCFLG